MVARKKRMRTRARWPLRTLTWRLAGQASLGHLVLALRPTLAPLAPAFGLSFRIYLAEFVVHADDVLGIADRGSVLVDRGFPAVGSQGRERTVPEHERVAYLFVGEFRFQRRRRDEGVVTGEGLPEIFDLQLCSPSSEDFRVEVANCMLFGKFVEADTGVVSQPGQIPAKDHFTF